MLLAWARASLGVLSERAEWRFGERMPGPVLISCSRQTNAK
jgi:hypothetical protein